MFVCPLDCIEARALFRDFWKISVSLDNCARVASHHAINEAVEVGVELSYWDTEYKNASDGDNVRAQTSFIYRF